MAGGRRATLGSACILQGCGIRWCSRPGRGPRAPVERLPVGPPPRATRACRGANTPPTRSAGPCVSPQPLSRCLQCGAHRGFQSAGSCKPPPQVSVSRGGGGNNTDSLPPTTRIAKALDLDPKWVEEVSDLFKRVTCGKRLPTAREWLQLSELSPERRELFKKGMELALEVDDASQELSLPPLGNTGRLVAQLIRANPGLNMKKIRKDLLAQGSDLHASTLREIFKRELVPRGFSCKQGGGGGYYPPSA